MEEELAEVESQIVSLQAEELLYEDGRRQLAAASDHLAELEGKKLERLQLKQEREEATTLLSGEIAKLAPSTPKP